MGFSACNIAKHASNNGAFLYKNQLIVHEKKQSRFYSGDLESQIKQQPNKKILGVYRLSMRFFLLGSGEKDNKIKRFMRYNLGDPPVILDSSFIYASIKGMKAYLKTQGFYQSEIKFEVTGKNHRKKVNYTVFLGMPYTIYSSQIHVADQKLDSILRSNSDETLIREGNQLKLENLLNEQSRITDLMRNQGYFDFNKEAIEFDIDTAFGPNFKAFVAPNIRNPENFGRYHPYKVNSVQIQIDNARFLSDSSEKWIEQKTPTFSLKTRGFLLKPNVLEPIILLEPDRLFSQRRSNRTFQRLNDLQVFRTVNITASPVNQGTDSASLNYTIKLTPAKKFDFSIEPQLITSDQANLVTGSSFRNYGLATMLSSNINNIFHGAEVLQLRYRISVEAQRGPSIPTTPFFNSFESSLSANLVFPRLMGLSRLDRYFDRSVNKTILVASAIYEQNVSWIRNVFTVGLNYQVSKARVTYNFAPVEVSFIKTDFANSSLEQQSKNDPYLQNIFANNLITDSRFGLLYTSQTNRKNQNYYVVRWDAIELAGIIPYLVYRASGVSKNDSGYYGLLNVRFFNYLKSYVDVRYNHILDVNNRLAFRIAGGLALPFWNSPDFVPFDKRFFNGGANSIRAFLPRSLGPGAYNVEGQLDRSGDFKLEANAEYRFNIFNKYLEGALFVDAGNIWRIKDDGRKEATFYPNTFLKQLALGTGAGVRLNFDFLVFRVDWSLPVLDPRKVESERYVIPEYADPKVLWDKSIFNFGVGYPF